MKLLWRGSRTAQDQPEPENTVPIDSAWVVFIQLSLTSLPYLSPFSKYLLSNFNDLKLWGFRSYGVKVHTVNQKFIAGFVFDFFGSTWPFSIYLKLKNYFSLWTIVKIVSTSGLADTDIPDFRQKQQVNKSSGKARGRLPIRDSWTFLLALTVETL